MAKVTLNKEGFVTVTAYTTRGKKDYKPPQLTLKELREGYVSIVESTSMLKIAYPKYARRLISTDRILAVQVAIKGGVKWFIDRRDIARYVENVSRSRELRNFVLRIPLEQEDAVRSALKKLDIPYELEIAYRSEE